MVHIQWEEEEEEDLMTNARAGQVWRVMGWPLRVTIGDIYSQNGREHGEQTSLDLSNATE